MAWVRAVSHAGSTAICKGVGVGEGGGGGVMVGVWVGSRVGSSVGSGGCVGKTAVAAVVGKTAIDVSTVWHEVMRPNKIIVMKLRIIK